MSVAVTADVAGRGAEQIAEHIRSAVSERGRCSIALAGGTTPRAIYAVLAGIALPWNAVDFYFGDERCVPPDDADSNYRMAREALLDRVPAGTAHRMQAERADRDAAAADYAALLPERLDVLVLGIGEDGHTASLFPGSAALSSTNRVELVHGPKPPPWRLTITPRAILAAREIVVVATGRGKASVVERALAGDAALPASLARHGTWIVDEAAAGRA